MMFRVRHWLSSRLLIGSLRAFFSHGGYCLRVATTDDKRGHVVFAPHPISFERPRNDERMLQRWEQGMRMN